MLRTSLGRFRAVALAEGWSFILLLGVAMPLKYVWGMPQAVRVVGSAHGVLFVAFLVALASVASEHSWRWSRVVGAFVSSLVPFGTLVLDRKLQREAKSAPAPA